MSRKSRDYGIPGTTIFDGIFGLNVQDIGAQQTGVLVLENRA
jgi:hypothetical protein